SIDKVLRTLPMDFYCGKKHRYRGIFCKFGESIAKFDEKWGIFESPKPPKRVCRYAEENVFWRSPFSRCDLQGFRNRQNFAAIITILERF
ncbi:MAG: hypothetical protein ABFC73_01665, partial [Clostridiaceae bacterium]